MEIGPFLFIPALHRVYANRNSCVCIDQAWHFKDEFSSLFHRASLIGEECIDSCPACGGCLVAAHLLEKVTVDRCLIKMGIDKEFTFKGSFNRGSELIFTVVARRSGTGTEVRGNENGSTRKG